MIFSFVETRFIEILQIIIFFYSKCGLYFDFFVFIICADVRQL